MPKRYFCFSGDYHPAGGWGDFRGDYETIEEAQKANPLVGRSVDEPWRTIVDIETMRVVEDTASLDQLVKDWQAG